MNDALLGPTLGRIITAMIGPIVSAMLARAVSGEAAC